MLYASLILGMACVVSCHASPPVRYVSHKNCNGVPAGTYISHPSNCHQFVRCHGLRSVLGDCPAGTFFNPAVYSCDRTRQSCREFKLEKLKLSEQKQMDALADEEPQKGAVETLEKEPVNHTGKEPEKLAGKEPEKDAGKESATDSSPKDPSGVVALTSVTTGRPSLRPLFGASDPSAAGRPACHYWKDAQFPHPSNCEYYYNCQRGFLTIRRCYPGFGWDTRRQRCVPRREAVCHRR